MSNTPDTNEYLVKICLIGKVTDIKTQFIQTFAESKFATDYPQTLGVDITTKRINIDDKPVKLILVDTAGEEFFGKTRPSYYRGSSGAIILFDKSDRRSFEAIPSWFEEFCKYIPSSPLALVGFISNDDDVSFDEATVTAKLLDLTYFECKPTDFKVVMKIFDFLARKALGKCVPQRKEK